MYMYEYLNNNKMCTQWKPAKRPVHNTRTLHRNILYMVRFDEK